MHPTLEYHQKQQADLETAKAAFFAANGTIQLIPRGMGKDHFTPPSVEPPRYGYAHIKVSQSAIGRIIGPEEELALVARLLECKTAGMSRYKACKHIDISETLCRRLITDHSLDYPKAKRCAV